jgi:hypothetical protein
LPLGVQFDCVLGAEVVYFVLFLVCEVLLQDILAEIIDLLLRNVFRIFLAEVLCKSLGAGVFEAFLIGEIAEVIDLLLELIHFLTVAVAFAALALGLPACSLRDTLSELITVRIVFLVARGKVVLAVFYVPGVSAPVVALDPNIPVWTAIMAVPVVGGGRCDRCDHQHQSKYAD